ncbi:MULTISPECIES: hypothetical protein [Nocardia]|uniref:hypothetical protein n=1 Tax=Nocardia TaxID=1817 RepID=UPI0007A384CA|nr:MULTISPECIES: hypothetical protein [Nocardia]
MPPDAFDPTIFRTPGGPREVHADLRVAANGQFELFTAYKQAGFTEAQAMELLRTLLLRTGPEDAE